MPYPIRHSVQMYTLMSSQHQQLIIRNLSLDAPLACKKADAPLEPLQGLCRLETPEGERKGHVFLDTETFAVILKGSGSNYTLQEDAEFFRLKKHLLRCWINLLRSRQATSASQYKEQISVAKSVLKDLKCA